MKIDATAYRVGLGLHLQERRRDRGEFHVPANTPIEMVMTSTTSSTPSHLPAFRQKSDVLPNRYTKVWFDSGEPRTYRVYCSEYCGTAHSNMYAKLVVEPREDYEAELKKTGNWMVGEIGEKEPLRSILTYESRRGCKACHSIDGKHGTGPTFAADRAPLRRSRRRQAHRGRGHPPVHHGMTVQPGRGGRKPYRQLRQADDRRGEFILRPKIPVEQVNGVIEYIKILSKKSDHKR